MSIILIWGLLLIYIFILKIIIGKIDTEKKVNIFLLFSWIGITLVLGLRYPYLQKETDLQIYYNYFNSVSNISWNKIFEFYNSSNFEIGYILLNKLLSCLIKWPQFIIIFEAAFCSFCTIYFIKKNSKDAFISILLYLSMGMMTFQLTAFRQAIAIGICLLSIELIKKHHFVRFLLMVLRATSIHKTAIVFIISYFLINKDFKISHIFISCIGIFIVSLFANNIITIGNNILNRNYNTYIGNSYGGIVNIIIYLLTIITGLCLKNKNENKIGINMTIIGLTLYCLRYIVLVVERISFYFTAGAIISIPNEIILLKDKKKYILITEIVLVILYFYRLSYSDYGQYIFFWNFF